MMLGTSPGKGRGDPIEGLEEENIESEGEEGDTSIEKRRVVSYYEGTMRARKAGGENMIVDQIEQEDAKKFFYAATL